MLLFALAYLLFALACLLIQIGLIAIVNAVLHH